MAIVIAALVMVMVVYYFWSVRTKLRRNSDQTQQALARMFISAGRGTPDEADVAALEIKAFIGAAGWGQIETEDRIAHALSLVKLVEPRDVYNVARGVGLSISKGEI